LKRPLGSINTILFNLAIKLSKELAVHRQLTGLPDFSWYNLPKREKYTKREKIYQITAKHTKWPLNISDGHEICQYFEYKGPSKCTQVGIFGTKIYHLATLLLRMR
jgi:hypothetical protein